MATGEDMLQKQQEQLASQMKMEEKVAEPVTLDLQKNEQIVENMNQQDTQLFVDEMHRDVPQSLEPVEKTAENLSGIVLDTVKSSETMTTMTAESERTVDVLSKAKEKKELTRDEEKLLQKESRTVEKAKEITKQVQQKKEETVPTSKDIHQRLLTENERKLWGKMINTCKAIIDDPDESSAQFTAVKKSIVEFLTRFNKFPMEKENEYMNEFVQMRTKTLEYFRTNNKIKFSSKGRRRRNNTKELLKDMENVLLTAPDYLRVSYGIAQENDVQGLCMPETKELYKTLAQDSARKQNEHTSKQNEHTNIQNNILGEGQIQALNEWSFRGFVEARRVQSHNQGLEKLFAERLKINYKEFVSDKNRGDIQRQLCALIPDCRLNKDGSFADEESVEKATQMIRGMYYRDDEHRNMYYDHIVYELYNTSFPTDALADMDKFWENFMKIRKFGMFAGSEDNVFMQSNYGKAYVEDKYRILKNFTREKANNCHILEILPQTFTNLCHVKIAETQTYNEFKNDLIGEIEETEESEFSTFLTQFSMASEELKSMQDEKNCIPDYSSFKSELDNKEKEHRDKLKEIVPADKLDEYSRIREYSSHDTAMKLHFMETNGYSARIDNIDFYNKGDGGTNQNIDRCWIRQLKTVNYNENGQPATADDCFAQEWNKGYTEALISNEKENIVPYLDEMYKEIVNVHIPEDIFNLEEYTELMKELNIHSSDDAFKFSDKIMGNSKIEEALNKLAAYTNGLLSDNRRIADLVLTYRSNLKQHPLLKEYFVELEKRADYAKYEAVENFFIYLSGLADSLFIYTSGGVSITPTDYTNVSPEAYKLSLSGGLYELAEKFTVLKNLNA